MSLIKSNPLRGMIGSAPCDKVLEDLLFKCGDKKIISKVGNRLHEFTVGLIAIKTMVAPNDKSLAIRLMNLWRLEHLAEIDRLGKDLPKDIYTHFRNSVVAKFRNHYNELL